MTVLAPEGPAVVSAPGGSRAAPGWRVLEAAFLIAAPLLAFLLLHLRAMATPGLPDPAMHSVYLWDPGDLARRYMPAALPASLRNYIGPAGAYFRWGTRPGFLVPGRLAYLAFGTFPGFMAFRYLLALIAIVPAYVLGRRCYGVGVGALAVCLILASPVVVTAWGTDFPDSAAVSYMLGGLACLVMPAPAQAARRRWLLAAGVLLAAAVWSLATTALLVAVAAMVVTVQTAAGRGWAAARNDLAGLAAGALGTTVVLDIGSWLVLGRLDYVVPTLQAIFFLATPAQTALWHSTNWRWALGDAYLLVLPATCLAWVVVAARRRLPPPALAVGIVATLQLVVAAAGQFGGTLQLLEEHYLSSPLWGASLLTQTVVIAELTRPLARQPMARWLPAALVIAVALLSEAAPAVPALGWLPWGVLLAGLAVAAVIAAAWFRPRLPAAGIAATFAVLAAVMVLTVAPHPASARLAGTVFDPPTGYQGALGGSAQTAVDDYRLLEAVRRVVPNASYRGEQLVDCLPHPSSLGLQLIGLFHTSINYLPGRCPAVGPAARAEIRLRNAAQLVAMAPDQRLAVRVLLRHLAALHPRLERFASLRSGTESVQVAVIDFPAADSPRSHP
ncbi:MAG TPA: hypothetical protein VMF14_06620 [Solirubrobacteraceae bacterium]|nr:hypothetical protein [Solirubrobacteraceae bacterium]